MRTKRFRCLAIVGGERNPENLEKLERKNDKASREQIKQALEGDWRSEHLFELSQNLEFYEFAWEKIKQTDHPIEHILNE